MLRAKKVGLLVKIALLILLAYLIITLVNVRQQIGDTVGLDALRAVFDEVEFAQDRHLSDSVPEESGIPLPR